jgi:uncharacterized protein YbjT (DUF2867 family)
MFTVFGASGNTGSVVARRLLDAGKKLRLVVRDPNKVAALRSRGADVVTGDVLDANAVKSALAGAEGAYLLIPPDPRSTDFLGRARRIVDDYLAALTDAKVPHAVMPLPSAPRSHQEPVQSSSCTTPKRPSRKRAPLNSPSCAPPTSWRTSSPMRTR